MKVDAGAVHVLSVAKGMMAVADCLDNMHQYNRNEKTAIIIGVYKALLDAIGPNQHSDLMTVAGNMHRDARRTKVPELGAAVKYVQQHLLQSN